MTKTELIEKWQNEFAQIDKDKELDSLIKANIVDTIDAFIEDLKQLDEPKECEVCWCIKNDRLTKGNEVYRSKKLNFCPNCGSKIKRD